MYIYVYMIYILIAYLPRPLCTTVKAPPLRTCASDCRSRWRNCRAPSPR